MSKENRINRLTETRMKTRRKPNVSLGPRCRFCSNQATRYLSDQAAPAADGVSVLEKLKSITGLDLQDVERPVDRICDVCLRTIVATYAFKMRVQNNQKRLKRQMLGKNCRPGH